MKVNVLYLGRMECFKYHLIQCENKKEMIKSPVPAILIRHPQLGNLLYDTGNSPNYAACYPRQVQETYPIAEFISIEEALGEKGLGVQDIDGIILSHLHFDHAGGLSCFTGSRAIQNVLVSEQELKHAFWSVMTGQSGAYVKELFDLPGIRFKTIDKDMSLGDDLHLFLQASHTPGVLGMRLKTRDKGNLIVTSDTVYTRDAYEKELPPGGHINKTTSEFYDNLKLLKAMQNRIGATMLFGHDYGQIRDWAEYTIQ